MPANLTPIQSDGGFTTLANIVGGNISTSGSGGDLTLSGGNIIGSNTITANAFTTTGIAGNITGANLISANTFSGINISVSGNVFALGALTAGGNIDIDGEARFGGNVVVVGNIDFSGGGSINQIVSANGVFTGNAQGVGALYAGTPGYTPVGTAVAQFTGDASDYLQINAQNISHANTASMEYVITGDFGTDTSDYLDIGFSSSSWNGTQTNSLGTAVGARDGYLYVQGGGGGGNLVLGTTTAGRAIKFNAGGPNSANTVGQITSAGLSMAGNIVGGNLLTSGVITTPGQTALYIDPENQGTGYIQIPSFTDGGESLAIVNQYPSSDGIYIVTENTTFQFVGSQLSTTGNISAGYLFGNASQLTGLPATYGNSNVATFLAAFGSNTISTTGNITATNIGNVAALNLNGNASTVLYGNGVFAAVAGGSSYGDSNVVTLLGAFGSNTVSTTGNITAGNLTISGVTSLTGNITSSGYFISGNQATGGFKLGNVNSRIAVGGGNSYMTFGQNPSIYPDTALAASAGLLIGGGGYILAPNGSRVITLGTDGSLGVTTNINAINGGNISTTGTVLGGNMSVTGSITRAGNYSSTSWTTAGIGLKMPTAVYNETNAPGGTVAAGYIHVMAAPTLIASNATTYTNYATLFVAQPTPSTNVTVTNNWAIMASGNISVSGNVTVAGTGAISMPNLPAFRVYGNSVTNVSTTTNTTGVLNGNNWAVDYNQGSYLNSTTGTFTAPIAGLYQVNLNMRVANNIAPTAQAIVVKNRASTNTAQVMWESAANCTVNHFGVSTVSKLAVGDTLNLVVAVGALTFDQNDSWSVAFLG